MMASSRPITVSCLVVAVFLLAAAALTGATAVPQLTDKAMSLSWTAELNFSVQSTIVPSLPLCGDTALIYGPYGGLVALDVTTGKKKWESNFTVGLVPAPYAQVVKLNGISSIVLPLSPIGFTPAAVSVVSCDDGSVIWNNTGLTTDWLVPPVFGKRVVLVCDIASCTGLEIATGVALYGFPPGLTFLPCFFSDAAGTSTGRTLLVNSSSPAFTRYELLDVDTGVILWSKKSTDTASEFSRCTERTIVRSGINATQVIDAATGNLRYALPASSSLPSVGSGVVCVLAAGVWFSTNILCVDEVAGFTVMNISEIVGTVSAASVTEGQLQLNTFFAYRGFGPTYLNITGFDLNTGKSLYNIVPPFNGAVELNAVPIPYSVKGLWIVPFLAGMTAWNRRGELHSRITTVSGIAQLVGCDQTNSVVVAYQNRVAAYSLLL